MNPLLIFAGLAMIGKAVYDDFKQKDKKTDTQTDQSPVQGNQDDSSPVQGNQDASPLGTPATNKKKERAVVVNENPEPKLQENQEQSEQQNAVDIQE